MYELTVLCTSSFLYSVYENIMPLGSMGAVQVTSALRASMLLIRGGSLLVGSEEIKINNIR